MYVKRVKWITFIITIILLHILCKLQSFYQIFKNNNSYFYNLQSKILWDINVMYFRNGWKLILVFYF